MKNAANNFQLQKQKLKKTKQKGKVYEKVDKVRDCSFQKDFEIRMKGLKERSFGVLIAMVFNKYGVLEYFYIYAFLYLIIVILQKIILNKINMKYKNNSNS